MRAVKTGLILSLIAAAAIAGYGAYDEVAMTVESESLGNRTVMHFDRWHREHGPETVRRGDGSLSQRIEWNHGVWNEIREYDENGQLRELTTAAGLWTRLRIRFDEDGIEVERLQF